MDTRRARFVQTAMISERAAITHNFHSIRSSPIYTYSSDCEILWRWYGRGAAAQTTLIRFAARVCLVELVNLGERESRKGLPELPEETGLRRVREEVGTCMNCRGVRL